MASTVTRHEPPTRRNPVGGLVADDAMPGLLPDGFDDLPLDAPVAPFRLPHLNPVPVVAALCVPLAIAVTLVGMTFSGAFSTGTGLYNPGQLVTYGLPIVRAAHDLVAALTVGLLVLATIVLPGQRKHPGEVSFSQWKAVRWAAYSAAAWFVLAVAGLLLESVEISGVPFGDPLYPSSLRTFVTTVALGQSLAVSAACILAAGILALFARGQTTVGVACVLGLAALLPLALSGHAAGSIEHANAVNSLAIHLVGATVWMGGLAGLILLRRHLKTLFGLAVERYSTVALWAFGAVAFSGTVNAALRLGSVAALLTPYGLLVVAKICLLVILGLFGVLHRRLIIPRLRADPTSRALFVRFAAAEVVFLTIAFGVAVALSKSPTPASATPTGADAAREALLGFPLPPPVTALRMFTVWHIDWMWLGLACTLAGGYLWAVAKLRRRGDRWPLHRTLCWLLGCLSLVWLTSGGPDVYGFLHFSSHMIAHIGLMMIAPPLLTLAGPVLLALRALPSRHDGSRGPREWLLWLLHSPYLAFLSKPVVAGLIFAGSLYAFYFSPLFPWAMQDHTGHLFMTLHFLASGYLFFWVFMGVDPGPRTTNYPVLLLTLLGTVAFHGFFGVALMMSNGIIAPDWWHAVGLQNAAAILADQHTAGGIAWSAGELPMMLAAIGLLYAWMRSDERAAARLDRKADRDGDADLAAYNAQLERIAQHDHTR
ncbi:MAG TPA: cytochrome c oxidase assembly protein [Microbacteriaceae bacterium]|nr:cytochrome c oxidase assembly protein [Microbacteriaceae bacterium]